MAAGVIAPNTGKNLHPPLNRIGWSDKVLRMVNSVLG